MKISGYRLLAFVIAISIGTAFGEEIERVSWGGIDKEHELARITQFLNVYYDITRDPKARLSLDCLKTRAYTFTKGYKGTSLDLYTKGFRFAFHPTKYYLTEIEPIDNSTYSEGDPPPKFTFDQVDDLVRRLTKVLYPKFNVGMIMCDRRWDDTAAHNAQFLASLMKGRIEVARPVDFRMRMADRRIKMVYLPWIDDLSRIDSMRPLSRQRCLEAAVRYLTRKDISRQMSLFLSGLVFETLLGNAVDDKGQEGKSYYSQAQKSMRLHYRFCFSDMDRAYHAPIAKNTVLEVGMRNYMISVDAATGKVIASDFWTSHYHSQEVDSTLISRVKLPSLNRVWICGVKGAGSLKGTAEYVGCKPIGKKVFAFSDRYVLEAVFDEKQGFWFYEDKVWKRFLPDKRMVALAKKAPVLDEPAIAKP